MRLVVSTDVNPRAPMVDGDTFTPIAELEFRQAVRVQYYVSLLTKARQRLGSRVVEFETGMRDTLRRFRARLECTIFPAPALTSDIRAT